MDYDHAWLNLTNQIAPWTLDGAIFIIGRAAVMPGVYFAKYNFYLRRSLQV